MQQRADCDGCQAGRGEPLAVLHALRSRRCRPLVFRGFLALVAGLWVVVHAGDAWFVDVGGEEEASTVPTPPS